MLLKPGYWVRTLPLEGRLPEGSMFAYRNANTMNQRTVHERFCTQFTAYNSEIVSDDVIVVGDVESRRFLLVGALTANRSLTHFAATWRGHKLREIRIWQPQIADDDPNPERIEVLEGDDWRDLLRQYGMHVMAANGAAPRDPARPSVFGYCTWYYYYTDVTERDLLENVESLAARRDAFPTRYVQIDDGYQTFQGDWNDQDPSWPTPLREIAAGIRAKGMEAGIWTMPFHASTASRVFREHPEWFVKGADGKPYVAKGWSPPPDDMWATLDTTRDDVLEHLRTIFRTFREWGYTYFKMDGLGFALLDGVRSDPSATAVSAFRQGLKAIREAVPDSFLLACSQHFLPCVGLVDGARFSDDTHADPVGINRAVQCTLNRFWMFPWYEADPDCLIARQDRGTVQPGDARVSVLSGIMTGFCLTSDNFATIAPDRMEILAKAAKLRMRDVRPHYHARADRWPTTFFGTVDGAPAAAVINDGDAPLEVKPADFEGFGPADAAEELLHPMGAIAPGAALSVPPHDAVLVVRRSAAAPSGS
ncbi:MAG: alpha-galactosidase [Kiritimatiellae bacterium]|nr:alpha-galactosidase [Kiritimatiellia bacterium]